MISKIFAIAEATMQALDLILDVLKTIHVDQLHVRTLFISHLSGPFKNNLGPNILTVLAKEEEETLHRARNYFTMMGIAYDIKIIPALPWQPVLDELEGKAHDLMILQGEFAIIWQKDHPVNCRAGCQPIGRSLTPVLVTNEPEDETYLFHSLSKLYAVKEYWD